MARTTTLPLRLEVTLPEMQKANRYIRRHLKTCKAAQQYFQQPADMVSLGLLAFLFTPSSIGFAVKAQCTFCGRGSDVTDYSNM